MSANKAKALLRTSIQGLRTHFKGVSGNGTGDVRPFAGFLIERYKKNAGEQQEAQKLMQDMEGFNYYLQAMIEKKDLLYKYVGGDIAKGISQRTRIADTAERVGLQLPKYQTGDDNMERYADKLNKQQGAGRKTGIREDLRDAAKRG